MKSRPPGAIVKNYKVLPKMQSAGREGEGRILEFFHLLLLSSLLLTLPRAEYIWNQLARKRSSGVEVSVCQPLEMQISQRGVENGSGGEERQREEQAQSGQKDTTSRQLNYDLWVGGLGFEGQRILQHHTC